MQSDRTASANGHLVSPRQDSRSRAKLESLQARCRQQSVVIDTLSEAVSTFRRGATALKAENAELRAELAGLRERRLVEVVVARDARAPARLDEVVVSVELMPDWFRVGVQDSGSAAVIAAQPPSLDTGGGFGLNLVQMLSERWGAERVALGGTRVWSQLSLATSPAAESRGMDVTAGG